MLGIVNSSSNFKNVCIFKQYSEPRAPLKLASMPGTFSPNSFVIKRILADPRRYIIGAELQDKVPNHDGERNGDGV